MDYHLADMGKLENKYTYLIMNAFSIGDTTEESTGDTMVPAEMLQQGVANTSRVLNK